MVWIVDFFVRVGSYKLPPPPAAGFASLGSWGQRLTYLYYPASDGFFYIPFDKAALRALKKGKVPKTKFLKGENWKELQMLILRMLLGKF